MHNRKLLCAALLGSTAICAPALAQTPTAPPPPYYHVDANGVDLVTGLFNFAITEGSIGSGPGAISLQRIWAGAAGQVSNWGGGVATSPAGGTALYVQLGALSDVFSVSGTTYTSTKGDGSTLVGHGALGYTYTAGDGTVVEYSSRTPDGDFPIQGFACANHAVGACAIPVTVTKPDGTVFTLNWDMVEKCQGPISTCLIDNTTVGIYRLKSVISSAGYSMTFTYKTDNAGPPSQPQPPTDWFIRASVAFANTQSTTGSFPSVTYAYPTSLIANITDALGRTWVWDNSVSGNGNLGAVRRPGASSASTSVTYNASGVSSVVNNGVTTNYSRVVSGTTATTTITGTSQPTQVVVADLSLGQITKVTVQASGQPNRVTQYGYDTMGRLTSVIYPEGNKTTYAPDARGNVKTTTMISKTPGTPANIVTSAVFPTTCTNTITCNKPTSTTDARLNETDYTYDPTHGGVLTITQPAVGGIQPQTRFTYKRIDKTGAISSTGTFVLSTVSACQTTASCTGTTDESKATLGYGANMLPTSVTRANGTGTLSAVTALTFDGVGNTVTVDGPLTGTIDVTRYLYDADREVTETVGPDPDGTGVLKNRSRRFTYNADGQVTLAEQGTSAADGTGFVTLQQVASAYDGNARKVKDSAQAGTTTYAVAQYSYDAAGRSDCATQRMNPSTFSALPAVCTLATTGSYGPDRISRNAYDGFGELSKVTTGYGVTTANGFPATLQRDEVNYTYNANGTVKTLADAKNNLTTYLYDGFDRLTQTQYPSKTTAGVSNTADNEQLGYDPASNITGRRLRGSALPAGSFDITYGYDALNRLSSKTLPSPEHAVTYAYDNFGQPKTITGATTLSYTFDALGRMTNETQAYGSLSYQYDAAGRRTRLTWQDTAFINYDYDNADEMTAMHENGAVASLASFTYDDLGERKTRTLINGTVTTYGYDPISRLTSLVLTGGAATNATTLSNYSPAGEIGSHANSNDAFAWGAGITGSKAYTINGLNQFATIAGTTPTYDARGNLTVTGATTYGYTSENLLKSVTGGFTLTYDPIGRLQEYDVPGVTRFVYDGGMISEEMSSTGTVLRRYAFGPAGDEPIVWYEGSGSSTKRYMDQDERGSVTRISNQDGSTYGINSYDEYGVPGAANTGRFGYTGQAWLPEVGLAYYKARIYAPGLGRFLQTDPIGYADGPNWYNYVAGDPINLIDPSGDKCWSAGVVGHDSMAWRCDNKIPTNSSPGNGLGASPFGGGGGHGIGPSAINDQPPTLNQNDVKVPECNHHNSTAATIAGWADSISNAAGIAAGVSAGLGLATAPTGAGFAFFEIAAAGAAAISTGASFVALAANAADGNWEGAGWDAAGIVGGSLVGRFAKSAFQSSRAFGDLSASQARQVNFLSYGAGNAVGSAGALLGCQ